MARAIELSPGSKTFAVSARLLLAGSLGLGVVPQTAHRDCAGCPGAATLCARCRRRLTNGERAPGTICGDLSKSVA